MTNSQIYVKRGKRFFKYSNPFMAAGLTPGAYLVIVRRNCRSVRRVLKPECTELLAAVEVMRSSMEKAMLRRVQQAPVTNFYKLSPAERKLMRTLCKQEIRVYLPSVSDVVSAGIYALKHYKDWVNKLDDDFNQ